jgi:hypothetical protein
VCADATFFDFLFFLWLLRAAFLCERCDFFFDFSALAWFDDSGLASARDALPVSARASIWLA